MPKRKRKSQSPQAGAKTSRLQYAGMYYVCDMLLRAQKITIILYCLNPLIIHLLCSLILIIFKCNRNVFQYNFAIEVLFQKVSNKKIVMLQKKFTFTFPGVILYII
jgi:hypothetical protein